MDLDLTDALLSRLFHDLASPASAVANGAELLVDMIGIGDTALASDSLELTTQSANTVTRRLTFFRMAFGGAGSTGDITLSTALRLAGEYVATREHAFVPEGLDPSETPPAGAVKLVLNAVMVVTDGLPRPGSVVLRAMDGGNGISVVGQGPSARFSESVRACLDGNPPAEIDTRVAPARFLSYQAPRFGLSSAYETGTDMIRLSILFP